jgi:hypothetical protein
MTRAHQWKQHTSLYSNSNRVTYITSSKEITENKERGRNSSRGCREKSSKSFFVTAGEVEEEVVAEGLAAAQWRRLSRPGVLAAEQISVNVVVTVAGWVMDMSCRLQGSGWGCRASWWHAATLAWPRRRPEVEQELWGIRDRSQARLDMEMQLGI